MLGTMTADISVDLLYLDGEKPSAQNESAETARSLDHVRTHLHFEYVGRKFSLTNAVISFSWGKNAQILRS